ncbi:MAG: hypothetical protein ABIA75_01335 [Candidatus Neomarinimicrobiota bacterium]
MHRIGREIYNQVDIVGIAFEQDILGMVKNPGASQKRTGRNGGLFTGSIRQRQGRQQQN